MTEKRQNREFVMWACNEMRYEITLFDLEHGQFGHRVFSNRKSALLWSAKSLQVKGDKVQIEVIE